jgi:MFS family permease
MYWQSYHTVWLVMGFGWVSLYLVRGCMAPLLTVLMKEFNISHAVAGTLFSVAFYSYGFMQIPSGYLGDLFGRKKMVLFSIFSWFVLSIGMSVARTLGILLTLRLLTGFALGVYFANDRSIIAAVTPKEKLGQGNAISLAGLGVGFFISFFIPGMIVQWLGSWRWVFAICAVPCLLTFLAVLKLVPEPRVVSSEKKTYFSKMLFSNVLENRDLWCVYLAGFMINFGYWMMITWMPSIYAEIGIQNILTASFLTGIMGLIGIPGMLLSGYLSDLIKKNGYVRKTIVSINLVLWAILIASIGYSIRSGGSRMLITILFISSAPLAFGVWPTYYAVLAELAPRYVIGTIFGTANLFGMSSVWVGPSLMGRIKDLSGTFSGGIYLSAICLVTGALLVSAIRPAFRWRA